MVSSRGCGVRKAEVAVLGQQDRKRSRSQRQRKTSFLSPVGSPPALLLRRPAVTRFTWSAPSPQLGAVTWPALSSPEAHVKDGTRTRKGAHPHDDRGQCAKAKEGPAVPPASPGQGAALPGHRSRGRGKEHEDTPLTPRTHRVPPSSRRVCRRASCIRRALRLCVYCPKNHSHETCPPRGWTFRSSLQEGTPSWAARQRERMAGRKPDPGRGCCDPAPSLVYAGLGEPSSAPGLGCGEGQVGEGRAFGTWVPVGGTGLRPEEGGVTPRRGTWRSWHYPPAGTHSLWPAASAVVTL